MRHWKYGYDKSGNYNYLIGKSSNYLGRKGDKIVEDIINEVKYQLRVYNIYIKPNKEINSYNIEDEIRDELQSKVFSIKQLQNILDSLKGKSEANGRTKIIAPLDSFLTYPKQKLVSYKKKKTKEIKKVHEKEEEAEKIEVYKIPKEEAEKIPKVLEANNNIIHENENKEEEKKIEPNAEEKKNIEQGNTTKLFCHGKKESKNKKSETNMNVDIKNLIQ